MVSRSNKWLVMLSVSMGVFLATIDGSIVNIALPTLIKELNATFSSIQWVVLGYLLTVTTLMLSIGRLGDMFGKKSIYSTGFIIFTIGSGLCGFSPNVAWLIAFRVFQALGASMMMALGTAIVTETFPVEERGKALGIMGAIVSVGIVAGPTIGGVILSALDWHWIFFVNIPLGVIGIVFVTKFVPTTARKEKQKFDFSGAVTFFMGLICFLFALTFGQTIGFLNIIIITLTVSAIIFSVIFVRLEKRVDAPMVEMGLFNNPFFSVGIATGFLIFLASSGIILLIPFYLEGALDLDPKYVGLLLAVVPVVSGIVSPISGVLSDKFGPRTITLIGLVVLASGYLGLLTLSTNTSIISYILQFLPIGVGVGIFQSPNNSAIMGSAPRERLGIASGMLALTRTLGQTVGFAIIGSFWAYRVRIYTEGVFSGIDTAQPGPIVSGLHDTLYIAIILIFIALILSIWAFGRQNRLMPGEKVPS